MGTGTKIPGMTLAEALQGLTTEHEKENFKLLDPMLVVIERVFAPGSKSPDSSTNE
jgi:hypothetical protein